MHSAECDKPALTRLLWLLKKGEESGHPDHNITYEADIIDICPSCNGATLEALRHDCFDFEEVYDQYEWYEFAPEDGPRLRTIAARCEQPLNPFCACAAHTSLRLSAGALPRSSWDAIFESSQHRHIVTVSDGPKPQLSLIRTGVELAKAPDKPKAPDTAAVGFVFLAWPATLALSIYLWMRWVRLPWFVDAFAFLLAIPFTFVVAGALLAVGKVALKRSNNNNNG